MAVNYATKYERAIAKAFTLGSLTEAGINKGFSWVGNEAIKVFGITTQALSDYDKTASSNRFGTPTELQNVVQTMLLDKDRAFSITIDRATLDDTNGAIKAGEALKLEIDEQVTPEIDIYRINKMYLSAVSNSNYAASAVTNSNAYEKFLDGQTALGNAKVPVKGRVAFISYDFLSKIKRDSSFMLASEVAMNERINGMVGMVDGVKLVPVPSSYLPANVAYVLVHPSATVAAEKLTEYNIHTKVQGISGVVIEGRVRYDAFVINQKVDGIWVHLTAALSTGA